MKTYRISITNTTHEGEEYALILECQRQRFTRREFKHFVIDNLFYLACQGYEYEHQTARITCESEPVMTVRCDTEVDGPTITAYISVAREREKFHPLRVMVVAD